jgi:hypothetical protein
MTGCGKERFCKIWTQKRNPKGFSYCDGHIYEVTGQATEAYYSVTTSERHLLGAVDGGQTSGFKEMVLEYLVGLTHSRQPRAPLKPWLPSGRRKSTFGLCLCSGEFPSHAPACSFQISLTSPTVAQPIPLYIMQPRKCEMPC